MDSLRLEDTHTRLTPTILSQARSFHSFAIAHNNFAPNFAAVTCLLIVPFVWDNTTHHIFDTLHTTLLHAQTFAPPNFGHIDTLVVPIFATCLWEKRLDASYFIESLLFAGHQIGIHKLSFRKLFFPMFFFDRDFVPPPLHGRPIMDYNKDARTTTSIHKDTRAPIQVLHQAINVYIIGEEEQESRTTLPQGGEMMRGGFRTPPPQDRQVQPRLSSTLHHGQGVPQVDQQHQPPPYTSR
jgi:hypothetical protein